MNHLLLKRFSLVPLSLLAVVLAAAPARGLANDDEQTRIVESAAFLLRQCMTVQSDGQHIAMLRSLRHLQDPTLTPLFSELVQSTHPTLKAHGLLGLAECDPQRKLDLVRLAALEQPAVQAEVVSAAMDSELLTDEQAQQLIDWPGLDNAIKVMVAVQLVEHGKFKDVALPKEAVKSENHARRALAALLLVQMGEPEGMAALNALDGSDSPERDRVREMVLRTAARGEFDKAAPYAMQLATEPGIDTRLQLVALQVAMRFGVKEAAVLWRRQFDSTSDAAQRNRLALAALQNAVWAQADTFEPLARSSDPFLAQVGKAGAAIASKTDIAAAVVGLVQLNHPIANEWALGYAKRFATQEDAVQILMGLILAFDGPSRNKAQRLDDAISATQVLYERDPRLAVPLLRSVMTKPDTAPVLIQGVLLGLIRTREPNPHEVILGLTLPDQPTTNTLALLLLAKSNTPLTEAQMADLSLLVRGGGGLAPQLRLQAAWSYLKRTGQEKNALAQAVGR